MKAAMVLQRYYTDFPLPLRYSHQNRYEAGVEKSETKPFLQLFSSRMIRLKLMQNHRRQTMPFMGLRWVTMHAVRTFVGVVCTFCVFVSKALSLSLVP